MVVHAVPQFPSLVYADDTKTLTGIHIFYALDDPIVNESTQIFLFTTNLYFLDSSNIFK